MLPYHTDLSLSRYSTRIATDFISYGWQLKKALSFTGLKVITCILLINLIKIVPNPSQSAALLSKTKKRFFFQKGEGRDRD